MGVGKGGGAEAPLPDWPLATFGQSKVARRRQQKIHRAYKLRGCLFYLPPVSRCLSKTHFFFSGRKRNGFCMPKKKRPYGSTEVLREKTRRLTSLRSQCGPLPATAIRGRNRERSWSYLSAAWFVDLAGRRCVTPLNGRRYGLIRRKCLAVGTRVPLLRRRGPVFTKTVPIRWRATGPHPCEVLFFREFFHKNRGLCGKKQRNEGARPCPTGKRWGRALLC